MAAGRKIIHVDMDAFYASVEQRDRPELRGRPVVVGGPPEGRGVVAAASYEARRFGVRSAMSSAKALRLCPELVIVRPDFARYSAVSQQLRALFLEVTPLVEPLSLDEAYLDVTENRVGEPLAGRIAQHLKARIAAETGLTASAGVGPNKLVAKLASDLEKPDGLVIVPPERVDAFLRPLGVGRIWGVGPVTEARLASLGVRTVEDLRRVPVELLTRNFGRFGPVLRELAFGRDEREVSPHRVPKSRGAERTFATDLGELDAMDEVLERLAGRVAADLEHEERPGRTVTLKIRSADFTTSTKSRTLERPTAKAERIAQIAKELLREHWAGGAPRPVRLLGVSVSGLLGDDEPIQLELDFPPDLAAGSEETS